MHKITKPTARRGGAQILEKEEDAGLLDRCEAKRKEWAKHWQCDESVSRMGRHHEEVVPVVGRREKEDEKGKTEETHQQKVARMMKSAEGSAGLLHKISKRTAWRGGAMILK